MQWHFSLRVFVYDQNERSSALEILKTVKLKCCMRFSCCFNVNTTVYNSKLLPFIVNHNTKYRRCIHFGHRDRAHMYAKRSKNQSSRAYTVSTSFIRFWWRTNKIVVCGRFFFFCSESFLFVFCLCTSLVGDIDNVYVPMEFTSVFSVRISLVYICTTHTSTVILPLSGLFSSFRCSSDYCYCILSFCHFNISMHRFYRYRFLKKSFFADGFCWKLTSLTFRILWRFGNPSSGLEAELSNEKCIWPTHIWGINEKKNNRRANKSTML